MHIKGYLQSQIKKSNANIQVQAVKCELKQYLVPGEVIGKIIRAISDYMNFEFSMTTFYDVLFDCCLCVLSVCNFVW